MTIEQFCDKAYKGGWRPPFQHANATTTEEWFGISQNITMTKSQIMLSPEAWQAVGKVEGWKYPDSRHIVGDTIVPNGEWWQNMHRMIDALAEGKTIEQFLETL